MRGDGTDWRDFVLCSASAGADPDDWDLSGQLRNRQRAVATCARCPVYAQCLDDAVSAPPTGMIQAGFGWRGSPEPVDAIVTDKRKLHPGPVPKAEEPTHGYGGYGRGCRCEVCVSARAKRRKQYWDSAKRRRERQRRAEAQ